VSTGLQDAGLTAAWGALDSTNLRQSVDGLKGLTFFAPSNQAFLNIASFLGNASNSSLSSILNYHIHTGSDPLYSTSIKNDSISTLQGTNISIRNINGTYWVGDAKVITPNLLVAGGVIHIIDQ
jgi:uncharacterized surface protein with fasciclin (FAS1) repeats